MNFEEIGMGFIFVDNQSTATVSGDIHIPLLAGVISQEQIEGDLYDLCQGTNLVRYQEDITVFKNAGGAHFDLAVSQYVISRLNKNGLFPEFKQ